MARILELERPWPGAIYPLGANWDGAGTNFAVFSEVAEAIEIALFDDAGSETRVALPEQTGPIWHGYLPRVGPGQRYGLRVHGPYDPARGLWCNPSKLLVDPYARAIDGAVRWSPAVYGYRPGEPDLRDGEDSAPFVPRCVVVDPRFDWSGETRPSVDWRDTVVYEVHLKAFTARHPGVPPGLRGTYAGLRHPAAIDHLHRLGVTAVEIMPVHQFVHEGSRPSST